MWEDNFRECPDEDGVTVIVVSHPSFGTETFFLGAEQFQMNLVRLLRQFWVNGFNIMMYPKDK